MQRSREISSDDWRDALTTATLAAETIQDNTLEDFDGYHPLIDSEGGGSTTYGDNTYYSAQESTAYAENNDRENFSAWVAQNPSDSSSTDGQLAPFVDPNRDMGTTTARWAGPRHSIHGLPPSDRNPAHLGSQLHRRRRERDISRRDSAPARSP